MVFDLSMRPEFFACGSHKVIAPVRAPVRHQFIFLNICEKTALQTLQASWKCLLLQAAIFTLMYFQLFYITHSVDTFCSLWTRSSKALCTVAQHVHPQFWVKLIPAKPARVPLSHKHESKHRVLPPDFLSFNKGNERNKKQCRVAEITTSPTILKYDGFRSKISRQGSKNQAITWALPALHFTLICCKEKDYLHMHLILAQRQKKKKKEQSQEDK